MMTRRVKRMETPARPQSMMIDEPTERTRVLARQEMMIRGLDQEN